MLKEMQIGPVLFDFSRPYIMGILNLTPDSFSDGGEYLQPQKALKQIEKMITDGADIIDIGAVSTRPGAKEVKLEEEIARLKPILSQYKKQFSVPLSLDTTKAEVAKFGLDMGVDLINDISGLNADEKMGQVAASYNVPVVLMHIKGTPKTMQIKPEYNDVITDILADLKKSISKAKKAGIKKIIIDPGVGFGKTVEHNLEIIKNLKKFSDLGHPVLIGTSRKSFLGSISGNDEHNRLAETIASNVVAYFNGANFFRVHDVKLVKDALKIAQRLVN
jgi:dihydropteroate synthase